MPKPVKVAERNAVEDALSRCPPILGIDPGKNGGIVLLMAGLEFNVMPDTERDIWDQLKKVREITKGSAVVYLEVVNGYQGEKTAAPGSRMFNFGWGYGGLRMAIIGNGLRLEEVRPQAWQKALGIPPRKKREGETQTQWKNRLKAKAQQLFPEITVTLAIADALLIAEYGKRKESGLL